LRGNTLANPFALSVSSTTTMIVFSPGT